MFRFTIRDIRYRLRTLIVLVAVGHPVLFAGCSGTHSPSTPVPKRITTTPARKAEILQAAGEVKPGMTPMEVEQLVGKPDEVLPLYEPVIKNPKQIGTTHWYIIEGSADELSHSKAVRVSFDLEDRVTSVVRLRVDDGPPAP
ncbi:MAG TPA: hypothetical protein VMP01_21895 [Pirellulaceae bacterium]|nr:hypothetical protein [Pirellulaceae bacterium]